MLFKYFKSLQTIALVVWLAIGDKPWAGLTVVLPVDQREAPLLLLLPWYRLPSTRLVAHPWLWAWAERTGERRKVQILAEPPAPAPLCLRQDLSSPAAWHLQVFYALCAFKGRGREAGSLGFGPSSGSSLYYAVTELLIQPFLLADLSLGPWIGRQGWKYLLSHYATAWLGNTLNLSKLLSLLCL